MAVYVDVRYRRASGGVVVDETFVLFIARLRERLDRLVLLGRVEPDTGGPSNPLPRDVTVVALPDYAALTRPLEVLRASTSSVRRFGEVLRGVDAVLLLGPHPLSVVMALRAMALGKTTVLGVREVLPDYVRTRHPGNRALLGAAYLLDAVWRLLAVRCPTVVVGPDLARRYQRARRLVPITVSLLEDDDIRDAGEVPDSPRDPVVTVLSVGRLDPEKNPLLLADVLARLVRGGGRWRLVVCGDGSLRGALVDRLEELGVAEHCDLLGSVPYVELADRYRSSDVLLHVSWTEGVPQVLLEAFAAGLPVAATDVGGVRVATDGAALLFPPGDPAAAEAAVRELAAPGSSRRAAVLRGSEVARCNTGARARAAIADALGIPPPPPAGAVRPAAAGHAVLDTGSPGGRAR